MAKAAPVAVKAAAVIVPATPDEDETPAAQNADELRQNAEPATAGLPAKTAMAANEPEPLPQADPRWISPSSKSAKPAKTHSIVVNPTATTEDAEGEPVVVNAFAAQDKRATAAIPTQKPSSGAAETRTRPGKALQAVTMRAKPSSRGAVLGTVPGRADVEVVSCDGWCEIVYNGKRGFVYKRFLKNNGR